MKVLIVIAALIALLATASAQDDGRVFPLGHTRILDSQLMLKFINDIRSPFGEVEEVEASRPLQWSTSSIPFVLPSLLVPPCDSSSLLSYKFTIISLIHLIDPLIRP